jgi:putative hydrolase of the HAD superfamily
VAVRPPFDAVTFDFWNTLAVPRNEDYRASRIAAVTAVLAEVGVPVAADELERAFVDLFEIFNQRWADNQQFTAREAAALVLERLDAELAHPESEKVVVAFGGAAAEHVPDLAPNVAETLAALADRNVRLGIICDVGMAPSTYLRGYLVTHGVLEHFDHWSFSDEVGVYKPHREIFEHALAGLGSPEPSRVAHGGDLRRTAIAGAQALGITAVRDRGIEDDPPAAEGPHDEADHVIDDHADLHTVLGLD